jgi:hypothetical protein
MKKHLMMPGQILLRSIETGTGKKLLKNMPYQDLRKYIKMHEYKGNKFNIEEYEKFHIEVDQVNHPTHYTSDPSGVECIQITRHRNFNIGNAFKYLWRAGIKDDQRQIEDLQKAIFYINDEINRLEGKYNA